MKQAIQYGLYILAGAAAYWIPDIVIQWIRPPHRVWILMLTFFVPAIVGIAWFFLAQRPTYNRFRTSLPLFMLLGIWMLGPLAMAIETIPAGGKFLETGQLGSFFIVWAMFPISTFIMSTYSGSLGGIGLATLVLIVAAIYSAVRSRNSQVRVKADTP